MAKKRNKGQAIILVLVALSLFLIAAIGLAIDGSQLYAHRQMAQAAADSAATASIMTILNKTDTGTNNFDQTPPIPPPAFTCAAGSVFTPCVWAKKNGFSAENGDTVRVDFPAGITDPGVALSGQFPVNMLRVTIVHSVRSSLMGWVGTPLSRVAAQATAAILDVVVPVPILVTHPYLAGAFRRGGNGTITICGGPARSIQVNSCANPRAPIPCDTSGFSIVDNGTAAIDLSKAGPLDSGFCTTGTGADFGDLGGPGAYPGTLLLGTLPGKYIQPAAQIHDPLKDVPTPAVPPVSQTAPGGAFGGPLAVPNGVDNCPAAPRFPCRLYLPGLYNGGIQSKLETALFAPGLYYMNTGGFHAGANSDAQMATCNAPAVTTVTPNLPALPADANTNCGMVVYNTGNATNGKDIFDVGANGNVSLLGAPIDSIYKGVLFFEDRDSVAHTGVNDSHKLGGGGTLALIGTIYVTNWEQCPTLGSCTTMASLGLNTRYQQTTLRGATGSTTTIQGQIITGTLDVGGTGNITMDLQRIDLHIPQVALVR